MFASLISKKADKTWNNDKDRASRLEKEQQNLSERMVSTIQRKIQEKDELARQSAGAEVKQAPQAPAKQGRSGETGAPGTSGRGRSETGASAIIWRENGGKIASTLEEMQIQKNADQAQALQKAEKAPAAPGSCNKSKHTRTNRAETGSYSTSREKLAKSPPVQRKAIKTI